MILGREPDDEGMGALLDSGLGCEDVARGLITSEEYRRRQLQLKTAMQYGAAFVVPAHEAMYDSDYEPYVFHAIMPQLKSGSVFLDVGANIGVFAVHAAKAGALSIAVEARPSNVPLLIENARRNRVSVEVHPLAASDHKGYVAMEVSHPVNARVMAEAGIADVIVAADRLDTVLAGRRVDVMKIDIEGFEYRALLGAVEMLRSLPVIITEYDPRFVQESSGVAGSVYLEFLLGRGYSVSVLHRDGSVEPIKGAEQADAICAAQGYHVDLFMEAHR
jgi:FkbM family methyltransferase